ncbi:ABC transporter ATP-binding protein [Candidatus Saccharibacteria bacterium]|nr:ABC transporter ATP-binding protein [Candidatus Saccharibacteria bacterium]
MKKEIGTRKEIISDGDIAISVRNLHKSFSLPTEQAFGLKQAIFNRLRGIRGYKEQKVLKGLNLDIKKGEFVGIVGRNGSGKSTLLKILAGIYYPQKGEITVNGTLVPFIELGVGFNPELTGRENVYLNGALLGFSNEEMNKMYSDIWKFAELEEFQDQKLKNYSSGMQVRLAFSIAIRARGDILLLDEVLAVGDAAFQKKCTDYFSDLKKNKQTVILVTHSMDNVRDFCTRAILLENGKIIKDGDPKEIASAYTKMLI